MSSINQKYIIFPKLHLKHLIFLIIFIILFIKKLVQTYFEQNQRIAIEFLKLYMYDVGDSLSIIPYLIMKKRNKNTSKMELFMTNSEESIESSKNSIELNYDIEEKKNEICTLFKNFLIFTLVDFTAQIAPVIYYIIKEEQKLEVKQANLNSSLIFSILSIIIFSRFILHINFHRHHVFSFIINLFCLVILAVFDIKKIYDDQGENIAMSIIYIFIKIFSNILYSLENVFAKYIFLYNYISPYTLLLTKSIYHFVYLII